MSAPVIVGNRHTHGGFTRWAVLVVLVVIGVLALALWPRLFGEMTLTEIATAKAQVAELGKAVEHFHQDTGRYPTDEEGLEGLIKPPAADANWKGPYVNEELLTDPWGVAYQYHFPPSQPQVPFDLFSFGKDRTLGGVGDNKDITYGDN
ncbi:type II secretion system major pseudopilin GspG [Pseudomonas sp. Y39-6]|jgi:general secretion pathway protein G|uniref:type II secretion system major pseudopilin GspG n=1 Tax=Pseudomonas TaxID=286 RepID=UPI00061DCF69|nr:MULTISPECIES: type II secretion system major pseudopilin GspG [Pseudomonas]NWD54700.1 type II secretion system major pseudopilin GspG [Pseudomonas veronii]QPO21236.1 type II secretion system major pseudopilin GspG [Pseudomonas sp. Y39-6]RTY78293.1 type II secretion system protein GspG [Pseudomonas veronii]UHG95570.1 type II secretion system major pseudopilin GspG [Pseudomonas sp. 7-41]URS58492.1 type II secretion system major pseudopilin GspG [Pseudomonas sp. Y39-6]